MTGREDKDEVETIFRIVKDSLVNLITKPGIIMISVFLLLIVWGPEGRPIFTPWFKDWINEDPAQAQFRLVMLSFASGFVLLAVIPILLIKLRFKESLADYGLGLGDAKLGLTFLGLLLLINAPLFYFATLGQEMQAEYPLIYQGMDTAQIKQQFQWQTFIVYELVYSSFFFAIEFVFRSYMLFGLREKFGLYSILIQMLSYTAWHLSKPLPELIGTPAWGFATAAVTLRVRSVWYVFLAHWLLNIFLDTMILVNRGVITF
jgi:hypothetical protein